MNVAETAEADDIESMMEDAARRFLDERHPAAGAPARVNDAGWQADWWRELASLGWPAVLLPEAAGGSGLGLRAAWPLAVQAGRHLLAAPLVANMALLPGLPAARQADGPLASWLAPMLAGDACHAPAAWQADGSLVVEYALPGRHALAWRRAGGQGLRLELHDLADAPVGVGVDPTIGTARLSAAAPVDAIDMALDERAWAGWQQGYRLLRAAEMLGAASAALDAAVAHACERQQFGRPIGANQAIKHRLADDWMALDDAMLAGKEALCLLERADAGAAAHACAVAELLALESAPRAAQHAIQVHGALGIAWESGLHLYLKRVLHIAAMLGGGRRQTELLDLLWDSGAQPAAA